MIEWDRFIKIMGLRFPFRLLTTGKKGETKIVELTNLMIII